MFLRRLSIQWKITLLAGLCLLGVVALLVGLSVYRMQHSSVLVKSASTQMLDESARLRLEARAQLCADTPCGFWYGVAAGVQYSFGGVE